GATRIEKFPPPCVKCCGLSVKTMKPVKSGKIHSTSPRAVKSSPPPCNGSRQTGNDAPPATQTRTHLSSGDFVVGTVTRLCSSPAFPTSRLELPLGTGSETVLLADNRVSGEAISRT